MLSTLISGGTSVARKERAFALCDTQHINPFDRAIFGGDEALEQEKEKIGIALIRTIQQQAHLFSLYSKQKAIIILEVQMLSVPAQNALLKLLEEPPEHATIIITAEKEEQILSTICSRCQSIRLELPHLAFSEEEKEIALSLVVSNTPLSLGERLVLAQDITQKNPVDWTQKLLLEIHTILIQSNDNTGTNFQRLAEALKKTQEAQRLLATTNVNPRLIVEHLFLSLI